jgi:DMSO/TMAO reductase YedYZ molybdopterin-dependent catalytic subunit
MSKNTVDPAPDPSTWRLKITADGSTLREVSYADLLSLQRTSFYSTMRCVSNTLKSDLMGTAQWTGVRLAQLIDPRSARISIAEVAVVGIDGHGDSLPPAFAFSDSTLLALGMNGKSLDRTHGFPLRLITPRYYGFKNVKWISEIALVSRPYFGTWPKMGYTKEPRVHTGSYIDRVVRDGAQLRLGGIAFAGDRGIARVQVRAGQGPWFDATLEEPLSPLTWRRWMAAIPAGAEAQQVEARAMDGDGAWQAGAESPLFPSGVQGPTIRRLS